MISVRRKLYVGGALAVLAIGITLYVGGAFDYFSMETYTERKMAALKSAQPEAAVSAPRAPNDLAGDPPRAELTAPAAAAGTRVAFRPPLETELPAGEFGDVIRRGREIFIDTPRAAPAYVGNSLRCVSCHLDAGRLADSSPLWAAFVSYPAYRSKTKSVTTFQQRLQGCFEYSMNGRAPALGAPELVALESYAYWLASGAPLDPKIAGRGYPPPPRPAQAPSGRPQRSVKVPACAPPHPPNPTLNRAPGRPRSARSTGAAWSNGSARTA